MKPKYITLKNYRQFKPSEFVRSFITDIEVAESMGKEMNMESYWESMNSNCLPCLGGMACMNFGKEVPSLCESTEEDNILNDVAMLGDRIRRGNGFIINRRIEALYPDYKHCSLPEYASIDGFCGKRELKRLKKRINRYADIIEASGQ